MGPIGALVATTVSYCLVWGARYKTANKIIHLSIEVIRDTITYILLGIQACLLLAFDGNIMYGIEIIIFLIVVMIYSKDIVSMCKDVISKIKIKRQVG